MFRQVRKFSIFLGLALLCWSCTRLPRRGPEAGGNVAVGDTLRDLGSVPPGWGTLSSTVVDPFQPHIMRLFFEDEAGTIRVVFYDVQFSQLRRDVKVIHRR